MKTTIHKGPLDTITPQTATPDLQFPKSFLPALDGLDPNISSDPDLYSINRFLSPNATFRTDSNPPAEAKNVAPLLRMRGMHLSVLRHETEVTWDIEREDDDNRDGTEVNHGLAKSPSDGPRANSKEKLERKHQRTVMFEGTSVTTFREDEDQFRVQLREFNILDLETGHEMLDSRDSKYEDLKVVEMRTYLDAKPLQDRVAKMQPESIKVTE